MLDLTTARAYKSNHMDSSHPEARFRVSLREGVFELSGSEPFVSQQIENFKNSIADALTQCRASKVIEGEPEEIENSERPGPPPAPPKGEGESKSFPRVIHVSGDQIALTKTIPGADKAKRVVNVTLAYLWAKRSQGIDKVSVPEIRAICEKQGDCVDSNFAANVASAREWIVVDGAKGKRNKICELTLDGIAEAERILQEVNGS